MKKIVILDFSTAEVHVFSYDSNVWDSGEDFFAGLAETTEHNFSESNCQWMILDELKIQIH
jgi:hypothetical protein